MAIHHVFQQYRIVADVPNTFRSWLDRFHDLAPGADWTTDLRLTLVEVQTRSLDLDQSVAGLRRIGRGLPPLHVRATGIAIELVQDTCTVLVPVASRPPLPSVRKALTGALIAAADESIQFPAPAEPRLQIAAGLSDAEGERLRRALLRSLAGFDFGAGRVHLAGQAGRSDDWYELLSLRLGETDLPPGLQRPPLLRHARGWRLAG